jgi:predicted PurR-regulated permease PerM
MSAEKSATPQETRPQWIAITPGSAKRTAVTVILLVVGLWVGAWVFGALSSFLFLLLLSWLLSIAMEPPVLWLVGHGIRRRGLATALVMIIMLLLVAATTALFGQVFIAQASDLGEQFPAAVTHGLDWVNATFHTQFDVAKIQGSLSLTPDKLGELAGRYGGGLLGVFGSLLTFVFDAVTILVFAYYLSADSPRLRQAIGSFLQPRYQRVLTTVWTIAVEKTGGYVISKVVLAGLSAFFHALFFWIIDVPFWLPLGLLAGIVGQFIPTIGTYIGVLLPGLFSLLDKPINALWIALFATVYQQLENYVFTPKISKRTMDVHPAIALASVFVGAALFGAIGALIGIPVAAAALTIVDTFRRRHELLPELAELELADTEGDDHGDGAPLSEEDPTTLWTAEQTVPAAEATLARRDG